MQSRMIKKAWLGRWKNEVVEEEETPPPPKSTPRKEQQNKRESKRRRRTRNKSKDPDGDFKPEENTIVSKSPKRKTKREPKKRKREEEGQAPGTSNQDRMAKIANMMIALESFDSWYKANIGNETETNQHPKKSQHRERDRVRPASKKMRGEQGDTKTSTISTRKDSTVDETITEALSRTTVDPEVIVQLLMNKKDRKMMNDLGFSHNYLMKLQRKVLHSSKKLQLKPPEVYAIEDCQVHVLFDKKNTPLVIKVELCTILEMKGTTFSYWKKKAKIEKIDTSQSFRLMDQCRKIFGGRSTYVLFTVGDTLKIMEQMKRYRHKLSSNLSKLEELLHKLV